MCGGHNNQSEPSPQSRPGANSRRRWLAVIAVLLLGLFVLFPMLEQRLVLWELDRIETGPELEEWADRVPDPEGMADLMVERLTAPGLSYRKRLTPWGVLSVLRERRGIRDRVPDVRSALASTSPDQHELRAFLNRYLLDQTGELDYLEGFLAELEHLDAVFIARAVGFQVPDAGFYSIQEIRAEEGNEGLAERIRESWKQHEWELKGRYWIACGKVVKHD